MFGILFPSTLLNKLAARKLSSMDGLFLLTANGLLRLFVAVLLERSGGFDLSGGSNGPEPGSALVEIQWVIWGILMYLINGKERGHDFITRYFVIWVASSIYAQVVFEIPYVSLSLVSDHKLLGLLDSVSGLAWYAFMTTMFWSLRRRQSAIDDSKISSD